MEKVVEGIYYAADKVGNPNWATILSVVLSSIAIVVAAFIPKKIAKQQNAIALFEKRYTIYSLVLCCKSLAEAVNINADILPKAYELYVLIFENNRLSFDALKGPDAKDIQTRILNTADILKQAEFLFPKSIYEPVFGVAESMKQLFSHLPLQSDRQFDENKKAYYQAVKALDDKNIFTEMANSLKLD